MIFAFQTVGTRTKGSIPQPPSPHTVTEIFSIASIVAVAAAATVVLSDRFTACYEMIEKRVYIQCDSEKVPGKRDFSKFPVDPL